MMRSMLVLLGALLPLVSVVNAAEQKSKGDTGAKVVETEYLITGLHCPPCTRTVESSLQRAKGIHSIKVDWKTKQARIEFDESVVSAQKVARLIADTPHMMGANMHYGGWLALKVPDVKDEAKAKQVKEILSKLEGVKQVAIYPKQQSVAIAFVAKGDLTSAQLIDALSRIGIKPEKL
jgi:copper chaperone CopZ